MSSSIHVVIIGLMGVGKSTLGRELATALTADYVDSDEDIERLFGASGAVVADRFDVPTLHRIEAGVLLGALAREQCAVITAAASVVEDPMVREAVGKRAQVIWLRADLDEVLHRQGQGGHRRPMDRAELTELAERRRHLFNLMADIELLADRDPAQLVDSIIPRLYPRSFSEPFTEKGQHA